MQKPLKLIYYRAKYNLKQEDLAKILGISQPTYSKKEKGIIAITYDEMLTILVALNLLADKNEDKKLSLDDVFGV